MSTELDLTARLDALGRSLASAAPLEPPAAFMQGVRHQHKVTMIKKSVLAALAAAAVIAVVLVASRQHGNPEKGEKPPVPRRMELPAVGAMRSIVNSPDDIDDAPLLPPKDAADDGGAPLRVEEWRKDLVD